MGSSSVRFESKSFSLLLVGLWCSWKLCVLYFILKGQARPHVLSSAACLLLFHDAFEQRLTEVSLTQRRMMKDPHWAFFFLIILSFKWDLSRHVLHWNIPGVVFSFIDTVWSHIAEFGRFFFCCWSAPICIYCILLLIRKNPPRPLHKPSVPFFMPRFF